MSTGDKESICFLFAYRGRVANMQAQGPHPSPADNVRFAESGWPAPACGGNCTEGLTQW